MLRKSILSITERDNIIKNETYNSDLLLSQLKTNPLLHYVAHSPKILNWICSGWDNWPCNSLLTNHFNNIFWLLLNTYLEEKRHVTKSFIHHALSSTKLETCEILLTGLDYFAFICFDHNNACHILTEEEITKLKSIKAEEDILAQMLDFNVLQSSDGQLTNLYFTESALTAFFAARYFFRLIANNDKDVWNYIIEKTSTVKTDNTEYLEFMEFTWYFLAGLLSNTENKKAEEKFSYLLAAYYPENDRKFLFLFNIWREFQYKAHLSKSLYDYFFKNDDTESIVLKRNGLREAYFENQDLFLSHITQKIYHYPFYRFIDLINSNSQHSLYFDPLAINQQFLQAVRFFQYEDMKRCLTKGANIDIKDAEGNTALHIAAMNVDFYALFFLIENKADLNQQNNQKQSVFDVAKKNIVREYLKKQMDERPATIESNILSKRTVNADLFPQKRIDLSNNNNNAISKNSKMQPR